MKPKTLNSVCRLLSLSVLENGGYYQPVNEPPDLTLLRAFADDRSEAAFSELVRRHVDLVYSAALRMVCSAHLAEDVTQSTFLALAKNAGQLLGHRALAGWLHRTAQNIAAQTVRTEVRRRGREQKAVAMTELTDAPSETPWEQIAPHLDLALGELNDTDRDALLLRYFERKSAQEMGQTLGISSEAAQKRVSRALERLREIFNQRGVTVGATGLITVISANAVTAAPSALVATITNAVALAGAAGLSSTFAAATKTIAMTTLQKTVITASLAALASLGLYASLQSSNLHTQLRNLQQQQATVNEQLRALQTERDTLSNQLSSLANETKKSKDVSGELLRLRAEVTRLQAKSQNASSSATDEDATQAELKSWLARVKTLKQAAENNPRARIPEFSLLTDQDWLNAAKLFGRRPQFDAETDLRVALAEVRQSAEHEFAPLAQQALKEFAQVHDGAFPSDVMQLKPYFAPPVDDAILQRYVIAPAQSLGLNTTGQDQVLTPANLVDENYDHSIGIGPVTWGYGQSIAEKMPPDQFALKSTLDPVAKDFSTANNGQPPTDPTQLLPYVKTDDQKAALEKLINLRNGITNK